ncbi:hypothetical protein GHT09_015471 [Marmota monax]|uniref:Uncharacterized protein n=1 Tax=Marmota monax TaxID=9995 RepID=A0A834PL03_MARMO|nr:hypothetical protein GHT09_015471 [Marmota monax]
MDHFQAILAQVRTLLSSRQPRRVRALLDSLREEELLSGEYHRALLLEPDGEALARKISLTLLGKGALGSALPGGPWNRLLAPAAERGPGCRDQGGPAGSLTVPFSLQRKPQGGTQAERQEPGGRELSRCFPPCGPRELGPVGKERRPAGAAQIEGPKGRGARSLTRVGLGGSGHSGARLLGAVCLGAVVGAGAKRQLPATGRATAGPEKGLVRGEGSGFPLGSQVALPEDPTCLSSLPCAAVPFWPFLVPLASRSWGCESLTAVSACAPARGCASSSTGDWRMHRQRGPGESRLGLETAAVRCLLLAGRAPGPC